MHEEQIPPTPPMAHMDLPPLQLQGWPSCGSAEPWASNTPRTLCHLQLGKFNALLSPSDYRTTEAAIWCGSIAQEGFFFNIIVDKIGWKYTWTIGIYLNVVTGPCSTAFMSKLRTSSSNKNNPVGKARRWIWRLQNNLLRQQWLPFSPRLFKHEFIVCRVLRVMGFLFDYIPSNFLLMAIWKNPVGRIWGTLQTSWASESLGLLQKAKRTENISQRDCTKWEGWRWWKASETIIFQVRRNCWDAQTQTSMEHSAKVNFSADHFPGRTQNPLESEISNCTGILAVKIT